VDGYRPRMKLSLTDERWRLLGVHTNAYLSDGGAPWAVRLQLAALIGDSDIAECAAIFTHGAPSVWTITAVTEDGRLVRVRMQFEAQKYDFESEQTMERQNQSVVPVVQVASIHRLADIVSLDIATVRRRFDSFGQAMRDAVNVGDVSLTFSDGDVVSLGFDQTNVHDRDGWARSDALLDTIRRRTGL
jgi:hypothetical protein